MYIHMCACVTSVISFNNLSKTFKLGKVKARKERDDTLRMYHTVLVKNLNLEVC